MLIAWVAFAAPLLTATTMDVRHRRIPNVVVAVLAGGGLLAGAATGWAGLETAGLGLLLGLALWLPFHLLGLLGAGDVKLFAAGAAWIGPAGALHASVYAALAGGALALLWVVATHTLQPAAQGARALARSGGRAAGPLPVHNRRRSLPYGLAIALGLAAEALVRGLP